LRNERALLLSSCWPVGNGGDRVRQNCSPRLFCLPRLTGYLELVQSGSFL
jgi:hypothetical protein